MTRTAKRNTRLRVVDGAAEIYDLMKTPETTAERIQGLQAQARALALEEITRLEGLMREAGAAADAIAKGGDVYPVGARELASRLAEDLPARAETLKAIAARSL